MFVPSNNPKSIRSLTQYWMKNDPLFKFILNLVFWGGLISIGLLVIWDMSGP